MNHELERYLVLRELGRVMDPSLSREEADFEQQRLESKLTGDAVVDDGGRLPAQEGEINFVDVYVSMNAADKADLPPDMHQWFLERIIGLTESGEDARRANLDRSSTKLAAAYFETNDPINRLLIVEATVNLARLSDDKGVRELWRHIIADKGLNQLQRDVALEDLVRSLSEIAISDSALGKGGTTVELLRQLFTDVRRDESGEWKAPYVQLQRIANQVGGDVGAELLGVVENSEQRFRDRG